MSSFDLFQLIFFDVRKVSLIQRKEKRKRTVNEIAPILMLLLF